MSEGRLLSVQPRSGPEEIHSADPELCLYPDMELVVLLDNESASASEVMAGALQDHARARIIGTQSWGKGVVNEVYRWPDQKVRLKLTTSYYLTPKGRKIERRLRKTPSEDEGGIQPDEVVRFPDKATRSTVLEHLYRRQAPRIYRTQVEALQERFPEVQMQRPLPVAQDVQLAHALADLQATLKHSEAGK